jgi:hypothetical protein
MPGIWLSGRKESKVNDMIKIISVIALSSVKFVGGPPLAYAYRFSYMEIILYTVAGGMAGVLIISYFSPKIIKGWSSLKNSLKRRVYRQSHHPDKGASESEHKRKKRLFTPANRRIIRLWKRYGLAGIAALTPVLFSIPIGTFFATRMVRKREKVFLYMFLSILFWSIVITSALYKLIPVPAEIIEQ